jgi:putative hydrolase of the HAD superfamily
VKIKAVLFDLGGTLIDSAEFYDTFQRILKLKGIERSARDVKRAMLEAELELKKEIGGGVPKDTDYYTRWNLEILHRLGIRGRDLELAEDIDKHWFDYMEVRVQPGAYELVKSLTDRGIKLGIVTNGYESDLEKILPKLSMQRAFDVLVAADSLGKRKPDPEPFLHAVRKLGVTAAETVFVGDEYQVDYVGAMRAGLIPFLFDPKKRRKSMLRKVQVIHSLPDLLSKINL